MPGDSKPAGQGAKHSFTDPDLDEELKPMSVLAEEKEILCGP